MHPIIGLVGPSGSGKSTLIDAMLERFPDRLALKKSLTTRQKRNADDERSYEFISVAELKRHETAGRLAQVSEYAGNFYADDRTYLDDLLSRRAAIGALVEQGVRNLRAAGYRVIVVNVVPKKSDEARDEARRKADDRRVKTQLPADFTVVNSFEPGGFDRASHSLGEFLQTL